MASGGEASRVGVWEPVRFRFRHLPIHMALLHSGRVLGFGGTGNDPRNEWRPLPAELFDPVAGAVHEVGQPLAGDVFCCGHSMLHDGRLLVAGGTRLYDVHLFGLFLAPFRGMGQSYLFDPVTEAWSRTADMIGGRWYPTLITLGDGRVVSMAGLSRHFPWVFQSLVEVFTPEAGWQPMVGAHRWMPLYPRLHLLPDGTVFYAGSYNDHYTFPFDLAAFPTAILDPRTNGWRIIGPPNVTQREEGTSVLLPLMPPGYRARVLLMAGGTPGGTVATGAAEVIDLSEPAPQWRTIRPLLHPRYYCYGVTLPDRTVLAIGGRNGKMGPMVPSIFDTSMGGMDLPPGQEVPQDPLAVRVPELLDLGTWTWTSLAPMNVDRMYHANALLLPDGRVMTAGSNPMRGINELRIEIFDPPYLFRGPRPRIDAAPAEIHYGKAFEIETSDARDITEANLVRPTVSTHCVDTEQRLVGLTILERHSGRLTAQAPTNPFAAPEGYYMLFLLSQGVPSVARFVRLRREAP